MSEEYQRYNEMLSNDINSGVVVNVVLWEHWHIALYFLLRFIHRICVHTSYMGGVG